MNLILFDDQHDSYRLQRDDNRYRHLRRVLRARPGDTLRVGVVNGPLGKALIQEMDEESIMLSVVWCHRPTPPAPLTVLIGHPRPPVLKRLWRDLASLGVREIRVFVGTLGEESYLASSAWEEPDTWLRDGLSQGGHTTMPRLLRYSSLSEATNELPPDHRGFYGSLAGGESLSLAEMSGKIQRARESLVCIGPERGLTEGEEEVLRQRRFLPVSLGARTLRTETATILLAGVGIQAHDRRPQVFSK